MVLLAVGYECSAWSIKDWIVSSKIDNSSNIISGPIHFFMNVADFPREHVRFTIIRWPPLTAEEASNPTEEVLEKYSRYMFVTRQFQDLNFAYGAWNDCYKVREEVIDIQWKNKIVEKLGMSPDIFEFVVYPLTRYRVLSGAQEISIPRFLNCNDCQKGRIHSGREAKSYVIIAEKELRG